MIITIEDWENQQKESGMTTSWKKENSGWHNVYRHCTERHAFWNMSIFIDTVL